MDCDEQHDDISFRLDLERITRERPLLVKVNARNVSIAACRELPLLGNVITRLSGQYL